MVELMAWSGLLVNAAAAQTSVPVTAENGQVWQLWQVITAGLAVPGMGAFGVSAWQAWIWFFKRKDENTTGSRKETMTYMQELQAAVLAANAAKDENTRWLIEEHKKIIARCEADKDEGWAERDRYLQIASFLYWRVRERDPTIPEMESIVPREPSRAKT